MARVTMILEDHEASGGPTVYITIASDPPLPITTITDPRWLAEIDGDRDLDMAAATMAQVAARMAAGEVCGAAKAASIFVRSEESV